MQRQMSAAALLAAACLLGGCGYVGDPMPPALHIPEPATGLTAQQRGDQVVISFLLPRRTTEGLTIEERGEIEVRAGPPAGAEFQMDSWAAAATRVPVPALDGLAVEVRTPVGALAGREVFVAVRTASPRGRWSPWSAVLAIPVVKPLAQPRVRAEASAEGVRLTWTGDAPLYRIYRQGENDKELASIGESPKPGYTDRQAAYDKPYRYEVLGVVKLGEREAVSDESSPVEITPRDSFAPAVPKGVTVLLGVNTVELAWERNTEPDLRGYHIYRATGDGPFERLAPDHEPPSYSDARVAAGQTYRYAVSAVDQKGNESARSAPVSAVLPQ